jgi:gas vesicle protein
MTEEDVDTSDASDRLTLVAAFAGGLLTGAALAVLLAPASGQETRQRIRTQAGAARDRTSRYLRDRNQQALAIVRRYGVIRLFDWSQSGGAVASVPPADSPTDQ